eukprot:TRINITY_DN6262_c0_g1_i1.p5 TRINITY_DN6262_c0_g1~~TRINITY_DN6262_c0_g1_i1.p5  ORF type:complete len:162 (-),score=12.99 TRINITY_DN6262_c0_g1_i1:1815-2300(-)
MLLSTMTDRSQMCINTAYDVDVIADKSGYKISQNSTDTLSDVPSVVVKRPEDKPYEDYEIFFDDESPCLEEGIERGTDPKPVEKYLDTLPDGREFENVEETSSLYISKVSLLSRVSSTVFHGLFKRIGSTTFLTSMNLFTQLHFIFCRETDGNLRHANSPF